MEAMSNEIAYYLCSIMIVLALIIAYGAIRNHSKQKNIQKDQSSKQGN